MGVVFLGLGSNLGNRDEFFDRALAFLRAHLTDMRVSPRYDTDPVGIVEQPRFLNAVATGKTALSPLATLRFLVEVERQLGRIRTVRWGPRTIDLDLLMYDDLRMETTELTLPHPRMAERPFVMVPLADLAPDLVLPGFGKSASQIASTLSREGMERKP